MTQRQMAKAIQRTDGNPIGIPTLAQLVNHELWPKTIERPLIESQAKALLCERGANADHIRSLSRWKKPMRWQSWRIAPQYLAISLDIARVWHGTADQNDMAEDHLAGSAERCGESRGRNFQSCPA
ncbi:hypothetical protein GCM10027514_32670 [Azotobacter armeniacus]